MTDSKQIVEHLRSGRLITFGDGATAATEIERLQQRVKYMEDARDECIACQQRAGVPPSDALARERQRCIDAIEAIDDGDRPAPLDWRNDIGRFPESVGGDEDK